MVGSNLIHTVKGAPDVIHHPYPDISSAVSKQAPGKHINHKLIDASVIIITRITIWLFWTLFKGSTFIQQSWMSQSSWLRLTLIKAIYSRLTKCFHEGIVLSWLPCTSRSTIFCKCSTRDAGSIDIPLWGTCSRRKLGYHWCKGGKGLSRLCPR